MIYDSVFTIAHGLQQMLLNKAIHGRPQGQQQPLPKGQRYRLPSLTSNASCWDRKSWSEGFDLFQHTDKVKFHGLTGPVEFAGGKRKGMKFDLLKLRQEKLVKVGEWHEIASSGDEFIVLENTHGGSTAPWNPGITLTNENVFYEGRAPNVTLRVTTILVIFVSTKIIQIYCTLIGFI
jgi:hypothetical protein